MRQATTLNSAKARSSFSPVDVRDARLVPVAEPNREQVLDTRVCRPKPYGIAVMQAFRIQGPAHWAPYAMSIYSLLVPAEDNPWFISDKFQAVGLTYRWHDGRALQMDRIEPRYLCYAWPGKGKREVGMAFPGV